MSETSNINFKEQPLDKQEVKQPVAPEIKEVKPAKAAPPQGQQKAVPHTEVKLEGHEVVPEIPAEGTAPQTEEDWSKTIAEAKATTEQVGAVVENIPETAKQESAAAPEAAIKEEPTIWPEIADANGNGIDTHAKYPKVDAEEMKKKKIHDYSKFLGVFTGDIREYSKSLDKEYAEEVKKFMSAKGEDGKPINKIKDFKVSESLRLRFQELRIGELISDWSATVSELLQTLKESNKGQTILTQDLKAGILKVNNRLPKSKDGQPVELTGTQAVNYMHSKLRGSFRLTLYNSGFWIGLRPFKLTELDEILADIIADYMALGKFMGGHKYAYYSIFLKESLMKILPKAITKSNFAEYMDVGKLAANISIHDYETILWGLSVAANPHGANILVGCVGKGCTYRDSVLVDLRKIMYFNTTCMPKEVIAWNLNNKITRTAEDLASFREMIPKRHIDCGDDMRIILTIPSIAEHIDCGTKAVSAMIEQVNGDDDLRDEALTSLVAMNSQKMYRPWIKRIDIMNDGKVEGSITDPVAVEEVLEGDIVIEYPEIDEKMTIYERDTKFTFYALNSIECPVCHEKVNNRYDNLVPMDLEHFFTVSSLNRYR